jgi:hypothetical protein
MHVLVAVTSAVKLAATIKPEHNPGEHETSVRLPISVAVLVDCEHDVEVTTHISTVCILYSVYCTILLKVA